MAAKKKKRTIRRKRVRTVPRKRRRSKRPTEAEIKEIVRKTFQPSYRVACYYRGFDPDLDARLTQLARRPISGSGSWLTVDLRDLSFDFGGRKASALKAAARIKEARIRGVRVMIESFEKA